MGKVTVFLSILVVSSFAALGWIFYSGKVPETRMLFQNFGNNPKVLDSCGVPTYLKDQEVQVLATGTYRGISARSGYEFFVNVEASKKPIVLLLSGYEAIKWNVMVQPEHNIKAIAVIGYDRPSIVVSDPDIPVAMTSYAQNSTCYTNLFGLETLDRANQVSQKFFHRPISMFYPPTSDGSVTIAGIDEISPLDTKPQVKQSEPTSAPIDQSEPIQLMPDGEGIQQALSLGLLRVATERDVELYQDAYNKFAASQGASLMLPPVYGGQKATDNMNSMSRILRRNQGYVILKNMRIPEGMSGGNSVTFILPTGVPYPKGELGHSLLLNMNDGSCSAVASELCGYRD